MKSSAEILTEAYAAFNRRDIDGVLSLMSTEVDWPNGWEGGYVHGHDEVRAYWTRQWAALDPHVEPVRITEGALGETVVDVHQVVRGRAGNIVADQMVQHVYTMRDGIIARMEIRTV
ncbi:MAG TPA: nuclear transport factor 2 family protein [Bryobacteraceae bacterium]|jgi:ketosteroid isomerase-like protein|nr:nuclear transport factor 2 family protein [Bryobacteraceae bacterium]